MSMSRLLRGERSRYFTGGVRIVAAALAFACRATPPAAQSEAPAARSAAPAAPPLTAPSRAPGVAPAAEAPAPEASQAAKFVVQGHELSLEPKPGPCVVSHRAGGTSAPRPIALGLDGPCYIVPWARPPAPPPKAGGVSDGVPVGAKGDARAYAYGNGVTVVMVIGNPVPAEEAERAKGYTCAGGTQAILLQGSAGRASKRIVDGARIQCVEWGGPDEQEFWIFGHE